MHSTIQVAASLFILTPFVLAQLGKLTTSSRTYLLLNLVGSSVLAVDAFLGAQWGFFLLEAVWAIVSAVALVRVILRKGGSGSTPDQASAAARS